MNRIDDTFISLKEKKEKALIPFIPCGYLSIEETADLVINIKGSVVELGVPFSDPLADGKVIQNAYSEGIKKGFRLGDLFSTIDLIREKSNIPLVVMLYYNIVFCYGIEKFIEKLKKCDADGIIVPDIPLEERKELKELCEKNGIYLIPLVAPTSRERIKKIVHGAKGFVYCVSSKGITGERSGFDLNINNYLNLVKEYSQIPTCVGFGISSNELAKKVLPYCDGIIVGSAIVKRLNEGRAEINKFLNTIILSK